MQISKEPMVKPKLGESSRKQGRNNNMMNLLDFLDARTHLYIRVCLSNRRSISRSVGPSHVFFKSRKLTNLTSDKSNKPANLTNLTNLSAILS